MFGMGWQEILVILVIGVLVVGPEQMPKLARGLGKLIAQFKRATSDLRDAVSREIHQYETLEELNEFKSGLESEVRNIQSSAQELLEKEMQAEERVVKSLESEVSQVMRNVNEFNKNLAGEEQPAEDGQAGSQTRRSGAAAVEGASHVDDPSTGSKKAGAARPARERKTASRVSAKKAAAVNSPAREKPAGKSTPKSKSSKSAPKTLG